jgi:hypothetical protein
METAIAQASRPLANKATKLPLAENPAASDLDVDVLVEALEAAEAVDIGIDVVMLLLPDAAAAAVDVDDGPPVVEKALLVIEEAPLIVEDDWPVTEEPPVAEEADTTAEAFGLAMKTPPNMAPGSLAEADWAAEI